MHLFLITKMHLFNFLDFQFILNDSVNDLIVNSDGKKKTKEQSGLIVWCDFTYYNHPS